MKSFLLHLTLAIMWLLLSGELGLISFVSGLLIGFVFLTLFQPVLGSQDYIRRCRAFFWYLLVFSKEFILSSLNVAALALGKNAGRVSGGFLRYDVTDLTMTEKIILSYSIGLTPGTTVADLENGGNTLVVHVLNLSDPSQVTEEISRILRNNILAFTREKKEDS